MAPEAQAYIDAIDPRHRPLFDRVHDLVLGEFPDAEIVFSYRLPTFEVGKRRMHVGAWQHGVSIYGITPERDGGFGERHPSLRTGKGTLRLTHEVDDAELRALIHAALDA